MQTGTLQKKIAKLPENLKLKVEGYVDALLGESKSNQTTASNNENANNRGYGSLKGKIWMSEDFNEPLDDFKDYM
jgi:hypothetical protein